MVYGCVRNIKQMIMNGILTGGLIQLAGSAFNAGLSELAAKRQYDRQLDFWQKQNEFNDPLNQRRRMERAGFNPAAFAGEVASNNVAGELSNAPGNEVMKNGAIDLQALNNSLEVFGKLEQMGADTDLMRRQIELSFIDEMIKNGEAYGIKLDNEQKQIMLKYLATEKEVSIQEALSRIDELTTRSVKNQAETITEWFKQKSYQSDAEYKDALTATENQLRDVREDVLKATEDDLRSQIARRAEQTAIEYAEVAIHKALAQSTIQLNRSLSSLNANELREKLQTFDARAEALNIANDLGLTQEASIAYANKVNDAWNTFFTSWKPSDVFSAAPIVFGDALRGIVDNTTSFIPISIRSKPNPIGY